MHDDKKAHDEWQLELTLLKDDQEVKRRCSSVGVNFLKLEGTNLIKF